MVLMFAVVARTLSGSWLSAGWSRAVKLGIG